MPLLKFAVNVIFVLALCDVGRIDWQQPCHRYGCNSLKRTRAKSHEKANDRGGCAVAQEVGERADLIQGCIKIDSTTWATSRLRSIEQSVQFLKVRGVRQSAGNFCLRSVYQSIPTLAFGKLCSFLKSFDWPQISRYRAMSTVWHFNCLGIRCLSHRSPEARWVMINRMMVSAIIAGLLAGYATLLYALVHVLVLMNHSYLLSLAM
jgi:hypothetical protein